MQQLYVMEGTKLNDEGKVAKFKSCPRPLSRKKLRQMMRGDRKNLTSWALHKRIGRRHRASEYAKRREFSNGIRARLLNGLRDDIGKLFGGRKKGKR